MTVSRLYHLKFFVKCMGFVAKIRGCIVDKARGKI
jgi:hypothetical protein